MADKKIYTIEINGLKESIDNVQSLIDTLQKLGDATKIDMSVGGDSKSLKGVADATKNVSKAKDELSKATERLNNFDKDYQTEVQKVKKELSDKTKEVKKAVQAEQDQLTIEENVQLSYNDKQKLLTALNRTIKSYVATTDEEKEALNGMIERSAALQQELKDFDAQMKVYVRNVGNYPSAFEASAEQIENFKKTLMGMDWDAFDEGKVHFEEVYDGYVKLDDGTKLYHNTLQGLKAQLKDVNDELESTSFDDADWSKLNTQAKDLTLQIKELEREMEVAGNVAEAQLKPSIKVAIGDSVVQFDDLAQGVGLLEDKLYALAAAGKKNTKEFKDIQKAVVEMKKQIVEVDGAIDNMVEGSRAISGMISLATSATSAFGVWEGAMAAFGVESEEFEKTMQKLQGVMTMLNSLQALNQEITNRSTATAKAYHAVMKLLGLEKKSNVVITQAETASTAALTTAQTAQTAATTAATVATKALGVALKAIGIGLVISLIITLITYWKDIIKWFEDGLESIFGVKNAFDEVRKAIAGVANAIWNFITGPWKAFGKAISGDMDGAIDTMKKSMDVIGNYQEGAAEKAIEIEQDKTRAVNEEAAKREKIWLDELIARDGSEAQYDKKNRERIRQYFIYERDKLKEGTDEWRTANNKILSYNRECGEKDAEALKKQQDEWKAAAKKKADEIKKMRDEIKAAYKKLVDDVVGELKRINEYQIDLNMDAITNKINNTDWELEKLWERIKAFNAKDLYQDILSNTAIALEDTKTYFDKYSQKFSNILGMITQFGKDTGVKIDIDTEYPLVKWDSFEKDFKKKYKELFGKDFNEAIKDVNNSMDMYFHDMYEMTELYNSNYTLHIETIKKTYGEYVNEITEETNDLYFKLASYSDDYFKQELAKEEMAHKEQLKSMEDSIKEATIKMEQARKLGDKPMVLKFETDIANMEELMEKTKDQYVLKVQNMRDAQQLLMKNIAAEGNELVRESSEEMFTTLSNTFQTELYKTEEYFSKFYNNIQTDIDHFKINIENETLGIYDEEQTDKDVDAIKKSITTFKEQLSSTSPIMLKYQMQWEAYISATETAFGKSSQQAEEARKKYEEAMQAMQNFKFEATEQLSEENVDEEIQNKTKEQLGEWANDMGEWLQEQLDKYSGIATQMFDIFNTVLEMEIEEAEEALEKVSEKYDESVEKVEESKKKIDDIKNALQTSSGQQTETLKKQLADEQLLLRQREAEEDRLAKEKEQAEKELEKKEKQQKKMQLAQTMIEGVASGALGVLNALSWGFPLGPIFAGIIGALNAVQIALIAKQMSKLERGGLVQGPSHAQGGVKYPEHNVELEGGEYVINKKSTAKHMNLIKAINEDRVSAVGANLIKYESGGIITPRRLVKYATGGTVNTINTTKVVNNISKQSSTERIIESVRAEDNKQYYVAVTDINRAQQNLVNVRQLAGKY